MTANAKNTYLRVERPSDGVVVLTLDDPDRRNAMSQEMTDAWVASIDELATDRSVRVVVVTGEGSAFCSGGITSWIAGEPHADVDALRTRMIAFYNLLPNVVGEANARDLLLTGRFVDAEEALAQPITLATADLQEGIAAAKEKRLPRFIGR